MRDFYYYTEAGYEFLAKLSGWLLTLCTLPFALLGWIVTLGGRR